MTAHQRSLSARQSLRRVVAEAASQRPMSFVSPRADELNRDRHRLVVLKFPVRDYQLVAGPVRIDRQVHLPSGGSGISQQPIEPMPLLAGSSENLVTHVEYVRLKYVRLVAVLSAHDFGCCHP